MKTIDYEESFGDVRFPDGFAQKLEGKTIEQQMDCYRITESSSLARLDYGELTSEQIRDRTRSLADYSDCTGLVVKDGVVVGALIRAWGGREVACLPYRRVLTYYASDNEGSGYNTREDYAYLVCV